MNAINSTEDLRRGAELFCRTEHGHLSLEMSGLRDAALDPVYWAHRCALSRCKVLRRKILQAEKAEAYISSGDPQIMLAALERLIPEYALNIWELALLLVARQEAHLTRQKWEACCDMIELRERLLQLPKGGGP